MKNVRSILLECNCYRARPSYERCKAVEEHVMGRIGKACRLESATMREVDMGDGVVQATVELVYTGGDCRDIIPRIDRALLDIGVVAFKAIVSSVVSHAAKAIIAGAGAGALASGAASGGSKNGGGRAALAVLAGTLIGAAVGAAAGTLVRNRVPYYIATKRAGRWHVKRFPKH